MHPLSQLMMEDPGTFAPSAVLPIRTGIPAGPGSWVLASGWGVTRWDGVDDGVAAVGLWARVSGIDDDALPGSDLAWGEAFVLPSAPELDGLPLPDCRAFDVVPLGFSRKSAWPPFD
ncbi:hypothetical protein GCM10009722_00510 [Williamsia deligens]|nr:hypothetical protein [Williamsia deligens]